MPIKPEHLDELLAATSSRKTCLNVLFWSSDRAALRISSLTRAMGATALSPRLGPPFSDPATRSSGR
jgi:hypothetical protein